MYPKYFLKRVFSLKILDGFGSVITTPGTEFRAIWWCGSAHLSRLLDWDLFTNSDLRNLSIHKLYLKYRSQYWKTRNGVKENLYGILIGLGLSLFLFVLLNRAQIQKSKSLCCETQILETWTLLESINPVYVELGRLPGTSYYHPVSFKIHTTWILDVNSRNTSYFPETTETFEGVRITPQWKSNNLLEPKGVVLNLILMLKGAYGSISVPTSRMETFSVIYCRNYYSTTFAVSFWIWAPWTESILRRFEFWWNQFRILNLNHCSFFPPFDSPLDF